MNNADVYVAVAADDGDDDDDDDDDDGNGTDTTAAADIACVPSDLASESESLLVAT